ncbi:hypothetical protein H2198_000565 [Neophaeococcomyces mojaviensis]|uniref:Uncharacterized protein n=1 Tax=Neophaeococcomyces mojaviensis TaxID=3383035 RepID=A0ACC3AJA3_9EURO|nr:hypothetical protein H2198_000565 [Knufia sp. JES_112]
MSNPTKKQTYGLGHEKSATSSHASRTAEHDAAFLLPHLKPDFHILDLGCGPGTITTSLARYVPSGHVTGIDISPKVLTEAAERAAALPGGFPNNVEFHAVDVLVPGYSSTVPQKGETADDPIAVPEAWKATFDVIYESQVFIHLPDPVGAMRKLIPCLKPGGMFALRDADCATFIFHPDPSGKLRRWSELQGVMIAGLGAPSSYGGRDLHLYARDAGLDREKMTLSAHATVYSGPEARRWWGELHAERFSKGQSVRKNLVERCGIKEEECDEVREALLKWVEDPDGVFWLTGFEVIARV